jgi:predicted nuclease of predicted toxin-antitoxin system
MRLKLLFDMNLPPRFAEHLCSKGYEAKHWSSLGNSDASDFAIMQYAKSNNYTVVSLDLDFSAILAATQCDKPSVIQVRPGESSLDVVLRLVENIVDNYKTELLAGAIITIDTERSRIRLLPL